ncbi:uncharacterized protein LOC114531853 [Dendronephthya gigantea]|uniref:uncharacterized protein LOC114531853 n=1 Tax=Dendronephthya gigantea TaxID=151771 RepID=UPI0010695FD6|nr:uncharacterized protein LOC114531853 [Dendronephthya gigantea]
MNPIIQQILQNIDRLGQELQRADRNNNNRANNPETPSAPTQNTASTSTEVSRIFRGPTSASTNASPVSALSTQRLPAASNTGPRFRLRQNFPQTNRGRKKDKPATGAFTKDVILLSGPNDTTVPRQGSRVWLMEHHHILSGVQLRKEWDSDKLLSFLKQLFPSKLMDSDDVEILLSVHSKLLPPTLAPGQSLSGFVLQKIFKDKPLYIRPSRLILTMEIDEPLAKKEKLEDEAFEEFAMNSIWEDDYAIEPEQSRKKDVEVIEIDSSTTSSLTSLPTSLPITSSPTTTCTQTTNLQASHSMTTSFQNPDPPTTYLQSHNPPTTSPQFPNPTANDPPSGIDHVIVQQCIDYCHEKNIEDPVEILRVAQQFIVTGRKLDVVSLTECVEGETNYILINRQDVLNRAMEEIMPLINPRLTLEVSFYGEAATDYGGPRREFFRLCMQEIKARYFDGGLKDHLFADYTVIGLIMALSILQNGNIPRFIPPDNLQELFFSESPSRCLQSLRRGLEKLGVYQIGKAIPSFLYLFHESPTATLSRRKLIHILSPSFSEEGSNARSDENVAYQCFLKYLQAAASGTRGSITLEHILQFVTGADMEPPLGFGLSPTITFPPADDPSPWSFVPSANTCTNTLHLPRGVSGKLTRPEEAVLFDISDIAFANAYFGRA